MKENEYLDLTLSNDIEFQVARNEPTLQVRGILESLIKVLKEKEILDHADCEKIKSLGKKITESLLAYQKTIVTYGLAEKILKYNPHYIPAMNAFEVEKAKLAAVYLDEIITGNTSFRDNLEEGIKKVIPNFKF